MEPIAEKRPDESKKKKAREEMIAMIAKIAKDDLGKQVIDAARGTQTMYGRKTQKKREGGRGEMGEAGGTHKKPFLSQSWDTALERYTHTPHGSTRLPTSEKT